jgi:hypothetical protein
MKLWDILKDLNSTDKYPIGTKFKSLAPYWCDLTAEVKPINNYPDGSNGKTLKWEEDVNGCKGKIIGLYGGAIKYDWELISE